MHKPGHLSFLVTYLSFVTSLEKYFSPFGKFVQHDKFVPFTGTFKMPISETISATETVLIMPSS